MPKFTEAVVLNKPGNLGRAQFLPGDEVPAWALTRIGAHVHDGKDARPRVTGSTEDESTEERIAEIIARAEDEAKAIVASAEDEAKKIIAEASAKTEEAEVDSTEDEAEADAKSDETAEAEESGEPDFTKPAEAKPAPAKRGRPRKA